MAITSPSTKIQEMDESLAELNRMADAVSKTTDAEPTDEEVERWVELFKYSEVEAFDLIVAQRNDITREHIPDEHWSLVCTEKEAAGYDREAYEHALGLKDLIKSQSTVIYDAEGKKWALFRLGGLLENAEKVREIAQLDKLPKTEWGLGGYGSMVRFCLVDDAAREKVEDWIEVQGRIGSGGEDGGKD